MKNRFISKIGLILFLFGLVGILQEKILLSTTSFKEVVFALLIPIGVFMFLFFDNK